MTHGINAHETAAYRMQTGRTAGGGTVYPSVGAVVSLFKGYDQGYKSLIPPYVVLTTPQGRFSESGFLGPKYKPFFTGGDPSKTPFLVEGLVVEGLTKERRDQRRRLLQSLDTLGKADANNELFQQINQADDEAYARIEGDAPVFDLSTERAMREATAKLVRPVPLVARRLVEQGVSTSPSTIGAGIRTSGTSRRFSAWSRRWIVMATPLRTSPSGLLDSTIVWWGGEFGRRRGLAGKRPGMAVAGTTVPASRGRRRGGFTAVTSSVPQMLPASRPSDPWHRRTFYEPLESTRRADAEQSNLDAGHDFLAAGV